LENADVRAVFITRNTEIPRKTPIAKTVMSKPNRTDHATIIGATTHAVNRNNTMSDGLTSNLSITMKTAPLL
jgi:hypothetical protein